MVIKWVAEPNPDPGTDSLLQEVLLWSDDRTRSADPDPRNGLAGSESVMFHQVAANQSARAAQTSCD